LGLGYLSLGDYSLNIHWTVLPACVSELQRNILLHMVVVWAATLEEGATRMRHCACYSLQGVSAAEGHGVAADVPLEPLPRALLKVWEGLKVLLRR